MININPNFYMKSHEQNTRLIKGFNVKLFSSVNRRVNKY